MTEKFVVPETVDADQIAVRIQNQSCLTKRTERSRNYQAAETMLMEHQRTLQQPSLRYHQYTR